MTVMIEELGYSVTSGLENIRTLEIFKYRPNLFDLVIPDTMIPNMTVDILLRRIKEIRPEISVILCSGFNERIG